MRKRLPAFCAALMLLLPAGAVRADESGEPAVFTVGFSKVINGETELTVDLSGGKGAAGLNLHAAYAETVKPVEGTIRSSLDKAMLEDLADTRQIVLLWDTARLNHSVDGRILQARFQVDGSFTPDQIQIVILDFYAGGAGLPDIPYEVKYGKAAAPLKPGKNKGVSPALLATASVLAVGALISGGYFYRKKARKGGRGA